MSYATYADLIREFSEVEMARVSDRDRAGSEDRSVIQQALDFADDLIDGYLRERYSLPLPSVPKNLIGVACDIARYRLYQDQPTELVIMRYDAALNWLKDVARGLVGLDLGETFEESPIAYSTRTQKFTRLVW